LGRTSTDQAKNVAVLYRTSTAGGACMPDPNLVSGSSLKLKTLIKGMDEMNEKLRQTISNFQSFEGNKKSFDLTKLRLKPHKSVHL